MHDSAVTPLRPRVPSLYSDTAALNDIHALLTTTDPGDAALADIAQIVVRTGRPMTPVRDFEISTTETALGWPVVCVQSGDMAVFIRQATGEPGLLIEVCTRTAVEHDALAITLDGRILHPARPGDSDAGSTLPARSARPCYE